MRPTFLALSVAVLWWQIAPSRTAAACTCEPFIERVRPANAATDVPRNSLVMIAAENSEVAPQLRVLEAGGQPVVGTTVAWTTRASPPSGWLVFSATAPFRANAEYTVELYGTARSTFKTGDVELTGAPGLTVVESLQAVLRTEGASPCWRFADSVDELALQIDVDDAALSHLIVEVRSRADVAPFFRAFVPPEDFAAPNLVVLSTNQCDPIGPVFAVGEEYCATVFAYDVAGNYAESAEVCAAPAVCTGEGDGGRCATSGGCKAGTGSGGLVGLLIALFFVVARRRR